MDLRSESCGGEFFAAANTDRGFASYFDELFFGEGIERRYIIKGGPGTGKSTLMKRAAEHARSAGRDVCIFYCSSDTTSVDAVVIDGRIAVLDGTAPHCVDTVLPGARDEIVDLGAFWSTAVLSARSDELAVLLGEKKAAYAQAYGYLCAAGQTEKTLGALSAQCISREKLLASVERLCDRCFHTRGTQRPRIDHRQVSALGVHGHAHLKTLYDRAHIRYCLLDHYGAARIYMQELLNSAVHRGQGVAVSHGALCAEIPTEMYFYDTGVYVYISDGGADGEDVKINMKRFTQASQIARIRRYYRAAHRASEVLCEVAQKQLCIAGELHARAESIYATAMDFEALRAYTDKVIEKILAT